MAWDQVTREPVVHDTDIEKGREALLADRGVQGVWQPLAVALFDIHVTDTDAQSYLHHAPRAVLTTAKKEKRKKDMAACEE